MKSIEMLVKTRDLLNQKINHLRLTKVSIMQGREVEMLSQEERKEYYKIEHSLRLMVVQAETISYVINYDYQLSNYDYIAPKSDSGD